LTLAIALAEANYHVTGFDSNKNKIKDLLNLNSYIHEVGLTELLRETLNVSFFPSTTIKENEDVFIISVGTPVDYSSSKPEPQLNELKKATELIGRKLKFGNLVILRSTVPVGTCRGFVIPILERLSGLKCGRDFHLACAPERTAAGNAINELRELPQIIGGFNKDSVEATVALFREITPTIIRVGSLEAAEMVKLVNNSFRDYVFAYSNYVTRIASGYNVNIYEIIKAANQGYPRDKIPLPSPGVGGPCLTKDPFIFSSIIRLILFFILQDQ